MSIRQAVLDAIEQAPALPASATQVIPLLQDPEVPVARIATLIELDAGLTSNVLRVANSAMFGAPGGVATVRQALVRLGSVRVLQIVLGASLGRIAGGAVRGYDLPAGELWLHSVAVAVGATQIARHRGVRTPDHAFTTGLLHDVGKIILGHFVEVDASEIERLAYVRGLSFEVAEREVLGIDHAEAGAILLGSWRLPASVVAGVRWHHDPDACDPSDRLVVDLVHAAEQLLTVTGLGAGMEGSHYHTNAHTLETLHLRAAEMETVLCETMIALDDLREALQIASPVGS